MAVLFTTLIPIDSIVRRSTDPADVVLKFADCLQVTYTRENEEMAYLQKKRAPLGSPPHLMYRSV